MKQFFTTKEYKIMLYRSMSDDGLMARIMSEAPNNSRKDNIN